MAPDRVRYIRQYVDGQLLKLMFWKRENQWKEGLISHNSFEFVGGWVCLPQLSGREMTAELLEEGKPVEAM